MMHSFWYVEAEKAFQKIANNIDAMLDRGELDADAGMLFLFDVEQSPPTGTGYYIATRAASIAEAGDDVVTAVFGSIRKTGTPG